MDLRVLVSRSVCKNAGRELRAGSIEAIVQAKAWVQRTPRNHDRRTYVSRFRASVETWSRETPAVNPIALFPRIVSQAV